MDAELFIKTFLNEKFGDEYMVYVSIIDEYPMLGKDSFFVNIIAKCKNTDNIIRDSYRLDRKYFTEKHSLLIEKLKYFCTYFFSLVSLYANEEEIEI